MSIITRGMCLECDYTDLWWQRKRLKNVSAWFRRRLAEIDFTAQTLRSLVRFQHSYPVVLGLHIIFNYLFEFNSQEK